MKNLRDESGQTVILVALCLTCILGLVGFATDVGVLLHAKRNLQIAADAAAIAGAKEINIDSTKIVAAGKAASAQNSTTDGSRGATVVINAPPVYGPNNGKAGYVEAIITQAQPTFFMRLFSLNSMPVTARAVAFNGATSGTGCLDALNPTAADTIHLQGSFTLDAPGCAVKDNSNNANALEFTGGGGTLTAGSVGVVGGATGHTSDSTPLPTTGIPQFSDPIAPLISPPTYSGCTAPPSGTTWGPATAGGTVCYSGNISVSKNITMNAGVYVFTGTLSLQGHGSLTSTGAGVTLYIPPGGSLDSGGSGNTTINLTAPTSGPYNGILIYQDANNTNPINLRGTPVANFTGIVYAPSAELELGGNTNENFVTDLIVGSLYDFGNAEINITDYTRTVTTSPLTTIALVE